MYILITTITRRWLIKVREGFVSNSSSSSFIIRKEGLTQKQIDSLKCFHHMIIDKSPEDWEDADSWTVTDRADHLSFYTCIDNFDLVTFLTKEGFKLEDVDQDG